MQFVCGLYSIRLLFMQFVFLQRVFHSLYLVAACQPLSWRYREACKSFGFRLGWLCIQGWHSFSWVDTFVRLRLLRPFPLPG